MRVAKKINKSSIKKTPGQIEITIGTPPLSKYEVMHAIAKTHSIYGATVWLNTSLETHDGKTPAELMREGKMKEVSSLVEAVLKEHDKKD
tara:strand:+ start:364 stop:633 length:270 start_codon:yes stop_codon:yes gene_type:complete